MPASRDTELREGRRRRPGRRRGGGTAGAGASGGGRASATAGSPRRRLRPAVAHRPPSEPRAPRPCPRRAAPAPARPGEQRPPRRRGRPGACRGSSGRCATCAIRVGHASSRSLRCRSRHQRQERPGPPSTSGPTTARAPAVTTGRWGTPAPARRRPDEGRGRCRRRGRRQTAGRPRSRAPTREAALHGPPGRPGPRRPRRRRSPGQHPLPTCLPEQPDEWGPRRQ